MNSHILDLLILDCISDSTTSHSHSTSFTSRILKALTAQLASRWHRREARRKRDAERRAALFIEAESRRRKCLDDLQAVAAAKAKRASSKGGSRAERRRKQREAAEVNDLPELVDASLNEEVEWRLRFSEAGANEARRSLMPSSSVMELGLSKDDAIQQVRVLLTCKMGCQRDA